MNCCAYATATECGSGAAVQSSGVQGAAKLAEKRIF